MSNQFKVKNGIIVSGSANIENNLIVTGSSKLGSTLNDTHQITGSLSISGSLNISGTTSINTVNNTAGDILTLVGNVVSRRTRTEILSDIGGVSTGSFNSYTSSINNFTSSINTTIKNRLNAENVVSGSGTSWDISVSRLISENNREISPNELSPSRLNFGFGSWDNNNLSPFADYLHFNSWLDASGGAQNLLMLRKTGGLGIRLYQGTFNTSSLYSTYKDVAWTDGTNSTGTWNINITGSAPWINITDKPTTLSGYGINDALSGSGTNNRLVKFTNTPGVLADSLIDSTATSIILNGNVGIGTVATAANFRITRDLSISDSFSIFSAPNYLSDTVSNAINYEGRVTLGSTGSLTTLSMFRSATVTLNSGSIDTFNGFEFLNYSSNIANNIYAFRGRLTFSSTLSRWNLYMDGNANNYISGFTRIGTLATPTSPLEIAGAGGTPVIRLIRTNPLAQGGIGFISFGEETLTTAGIGSFYNLSNTGSSDLRFYSGNQTSSISLVTERMRINHTGNVLIGTTTDNGERLQVSGSGRITGTLEVDTYGTAASSDDILTVTTGGIITKRNTTTLRSFLNITGSLNRVPKFIDGGVGDSSIIDNGNNVGIGAINTVTRLRQANGFSSTFTIGILQDGTISDNGLNVTGYRSSLSLNSGVTTGTYTHYTSVQLATTSTIGTQTGYLVNTLSAGTTANYGFRGLVNSETGKDNYNLYMDGTAPNYIRGAIRIGQGISPESLLHVSQNHVTPLNGISSDTVAIFSNNATTNGNVNISILSRSSGRQRIYFGNQSVEQGAYIEVISSNASNSYMGFGLSDGGTPALEHMRIGSSGNFLIGKTGDSGEKLQVNGTTSFLGNAGFGSVSVVNRLININGAISGNDALSFGVHLQANAGSTMTGTTVGYRSVIGTDSGTGTLSSLIHYNAEQLTFSKSVTTQTGYQAASNLIGATTNYGFRGLIPSGSNRWNLYMDGTANNYIGGNLGIATTNPSEKLHVVGNTLISENLQIGTHQIDTLKLPTPAGNSGTGSWFLRLLDNSAATFIGGKIRVGGEWSWEPIMGVLELEFSVYAASGSSTLSTSESRISSMTGKAADNLRISELQIVDGWIGCYISSRNSNSPYVTFDGYATRKITMSNTPWFSNPLPVFVPTTITRGLDVSGLIKSTSSGIVIDNQDIYSNFDYSGNDGAIRLNRFGLTGGTTTFRDVRIYNGKNSEIMAIVGSSGNVGIGTNTPTLARLQIATPTTNNTFNPGLYVGFSTNVMGGYLGSRSISGNQNQGLYVSSQQMLTLWGDMTGDGFGVLDVVSGTSPNVTGDTSSLFRINSDGNVGIGTVTTTSSRLTISGGNQITSNNGNAYNLQFSTNVTGRRSLETVAQIGTFDNNSAIEIGAGNNGAAIYLGGNNVTGGSEVRLWTASSQRFRITSTGNIGIGTNSIASSRLTIVGGALPTQDNGDTNALQFSSGITGRRASSNTVAFIGTYSNTSSIEISAGLTGAGISMHGISASINASSVILYANNAERMRIASTGNVGINTTIPESLLHVSTNHVTPTSGISANTIGIFSNNASTNGNATVSILSRSSGVQRLNFGNQVVEDGGFIEVKSTAFDNSYMRFGLANSTTSAVEYMRIDATGNVGIGTTTPNNSLHVVGASQLPIIHIQRATNVANGISWYNSGSYRAWADYMSPAGAVNTGPTANITAPTGSLVTSWGRRSYIENISGYGWTFESGTANQVTPTVVAEIRSSDGSARFGGNVLVGTTSDSGERLQVNGSSKLSGNVNIINGNIDVLNTSTSNATLTLLCDSGNDSSNTFFQSTYSGLYVGFNHPISQLNRIGQNQVLVYYSGDSNANNASTQFDVNRTEVLKLTRTNASFRQVNLLVGTNVDNGSRLQIYSTGSSVLDVQGSVGELFSVNNSLTGSVFSVNDISGMPIIDATAGTTNIVTVTGEIRATGTITQNFSDERLKEKISVIDKPIDIIKSLNGFKYKHNETAKKYGYNDDNVHIGLSAQEVKAVLPELVTLAPFDINEENTSKTGNDYLTLDYSKLVPVLIEAIKEQQKEIDKLKEILNNK